MKSKDPTLNANPNLINEIFGSTGPNHIIKKLMTDRKIKKRIKSGPVIHINPRAYVSFVNLA